MNDGIPDREDVDGVGGRDGELTLRRAVAGELRPRNVEAVGARTEILQNG